MPSYFKFRREELPVVGDLMLSLFQRDRAKFEEFSPKYNDEFIASVSAQIHKVQDLTTTQSLTGEIKTITSELYQSLDDMLPKLDRLASYVQSANKSLVVKYADFGIREAKKDLRKRNVEAYCAQQKVIEQNIAKNLEQLKAEGYKEEFGLEIKNETNAIYEKNLLQENKLRERKEHVANNAGEFDVLWKMLADISRKGKVVMAHDKQKAEEYMFTHIIKKVRNIPVKKKPVVIAPPVVTEPAKEKEEPQIENVES
ncbi:hypothetical protein DF185_16180 [Marinifilum breve]|uniref:Uncharacterized protein n=1 Tax=Marinifilum breve TaxID=2184082 RepID=A0A2V4A8K9_9BACT|nr:hypothetical protein [Marinifilum breve]PXX98912.1 hypothetical protein DF185_16180 [Marinifilum breve]